MALQHLRSNTASKRPTPGSMSDGQLAINTNATSPGVFFKDAGGALIKVGPVHIGTSAPNSSPASGGETGNSIGEQWLDTSGGGYVFKVWDGTAWRSETGQFVDVAGDTMTGDLTISGANLVMSNGKIIADGGAFDDPSISFTGDADTGIYSPGSDEVAISTGGTQRLQIDASGNVGIGTSSPSQLLHLAKSSGSAILELQRTNANTSGTVGALSFTALDGHSVAAVTAMGDGNDEGADLVFRTTSAASSNNPFSSTNEAMRIDSSGNVGIGTSSPDTELHVASTSPVLRFENSTTTSTLGTSMGKIEWETRDLSAPGVISYIDVVDSNNFGSAFDMHLATGVTGAATPKVTIKADGNVGIGTSSPSSVLEISSSSGESLLGVKAPATRNGYLDLDADANRRAVIRFNSAGVAKWSIGRGDSDEISADAFHISTGSSGGNSSKLVVTSSGNVGIGTTSPASTLHVNGTTTAYGNGSASLFWGNTTTLGALTYSGSDPIIQTNTGNLLFWQGTTERARIDSSGRLLVGTSSNHTGGQLQVEGTSSSGATISTRINASANLAATLLFEKSNGTTNGSNTIVNNNDIVGRILFRGADGTSGVTLAQIAAAVDGTPGANDMPGRLVFSTTADGASSPTERMRINRDGETGAFTADLSGATCFWAAHNGGAGSTRYFFRGSYGASSMYGGTTSFIVHTSGDVKNTNNSYGAISDIKLKENIVDANSQWDDLKALQVRNYNFKEGQTHTQIGLVAQEVELVSPGLVSESPDRDEDGNDLGTTTKSVNYSVLYMKAVKALQEAMERIETLEAKVSALEAN